MALQKQKISELPQDAVVLNETQALIYESRILGNWPDTSDTFGYKYGKGLLAVGTTISGMYANGFFRRKFKLMNYGRISSYLPISIVPAALSVLIHQHLVVKNLILRKYECPVCLQTRAAALQVLTGCVLPFLIAPVMSLSLVHRFHTYDMPYVTKEPLNVLKIIGKQFAKMKNVGLGIFLAQALIGSFVTYWESNSIYKVDKKLLEAEKNAEFEM